MVSKYVRIIAGLLLLGLAAADLCAVKTRWTLSNGTATSKDQLKPGSFLAEVGNIVVVPGDAGTELINVSSPDLAVVASDYKNLAITSNALNKTPYRWNLIVPAQTRIDFIKAKAREGYRTITIREADVDGKGKPLTETIGQFFLPDVFVDLNKK